MELAADIEVPVADGAAVRVRVLAPEGVADAPGTPFGLTYEPAPVMALGFDDPSELVSLSAERSVALITCEARALVVADLAEVMSRLGATQAHLLAKGDSNRAACDFARDLPYRALSVTCVCNEGEDEAPVAGCVAEPLVVDGCGRESTSPALVDSRATSPAAKDSNNAVSVLASQRPPFAIARSLDETADQIAAAEPRRRHRPLVSFEDGTPVVLEGPADILVRPAVPEDEPAIQAVYDHLLSACDIPGAQTCGWKRGYWPLPHDVSRRLNEGVTWVAVELPGDGEGAESSPNPQAQGFAAAGGLATGEGASLQANAPAASLSPASEYAGAPAPVVLGAMSLDGDFGLPGTDPGWEPLGEGEFLTCHLLATDPAAQGRGVATALLAAYAREGLRRGCKALRINTSPQSLSNRLYHELGFELHAPQWFPYEGLDITGWTNCYQIWLEQAGE